MAGNISQSLMNLLTEFLVHEIDAKVLDGITYAFVLKTDKNAKETYKAYMNIKEEAKRCGFANDEVFRVYEVNNGYIFDMDLREAKKITKALAKAVAKDTKNNNIPIDLIGEKPEKRRQADMTSLARQVKREYDSGKMKMEVALFSRNKSPKITITGIGPKGNSLAIQYNAYAIRHWDIETINEKLLVPAGIRIAKIEPCEILPSKTGVRFIIYLDKAMNYS